MWWGFFFAKHSEEKKPKGLSIIIRLVLVSSLVPTLLGGDEDDHLKWHLGATFSYVTSGKESWINEISVVLQLNRDEVLKRIQLLGQTNMLIFVLQVKFQFTSLFLKIKQGIVVLSEARRLFSNLFLQPKPVF